MGLSSSLGDALDGLGLSVNLFGGKLGGILVQLMIFILLAGLIFLVGYLYHQKKLYKHKIQIFEEINGQTVPTSSFKAKEMTIPETSIKVFQIKENKMFLPRPSIQTGINNWLFFIRDDHEWVNIGISSLNKQLTELGLKYNHVDMRYANASLKELIKSNYGEKNWWKEYGHLVILGAFLVISGILLYLVAGQFAEASTNFLEAVNANNQVIKEISTKLDMFETSGLTKLN